MANEATGYKYKISNGRTTDEKELVALSLAMIGRRLKDCGVGMLCNLELDTTGGQGIVIPFSSRENFAKFAFGLDLETAEELAKHVFTFQYSEEKNVFMSVFSQVAKNTIDFLQLYFVQKDEMTNSYHFFDEELCDEETLDVIQALEQTSKGVALINALTCILLGPSGPLVVWLSDYVQSKEGGGS